jgi:hypothetical protein
VQRLVCFKVRHFGGVRHSVVGNVTLVLNYYYYLNLDYQVHCTIILLNCVF